MRLRHELDKRSDAGGRGSCGVTAPSCPQPRGANCVRPSQTVSARLSPRSSPCRGMGDQVIGPPSSHWSQADDGTQTHATWLGKPCRGSRRPSTNVYCPRQLCGFAALASPSTRMAMSLCPDVRGMRCGTAVDSLAVCARGSGAAPPVGLAPRREQGREEAIRPNPSPRPHAHPMRERLAVNPHRNHARCADPRRANAVHERGDDRGLLRGVARHSARCDPERLEDAVVGASHR